MTNEIRELIETFDKAAQDWGWEQDWGVGKSVGEADHAHAAAKAALVAAIERLEAKAATARAECEAWRSIPDMDHHEPYWNSPLGGGKSPEDRIATARAATDEAWREQAQEHQS